ncbi:MAG: (d)CMP kinase [Bacillota bacterium]|jgi:cytidylate kinase
MTAKIIAIDGPAGAGKSTVAKIVAQRLGYLYIDTGAMYRSIAYLAIKRKIPFDDEKGLTKLADELQLELKNDADTCRVFCNGEDITEAIRAPKVGEAASTISALSGVREALTEKQRELASQGLVVLDGRDIGTAVLPEADCKIFLTASLDERAKRRTEDFAEQGVSVDPGQTAAEIQRRDERDMQRAHAPLRQAEDAFYVDSSNLSIEEVVAQILTCATKNI